MDGLSIREEFECDIGGLLASVNDLPFGPLREKVLEFVNEDAVLFLQITVDMQRTILGLKMSECMVEMVLDTGSIRGHNGEVSLHEVELELKHGEINEMIELGRQLQSQYDLKPSTLTKHQIGLSL